MWTHSISKYWNARLFSLLQRVGFILPKISIWVYHLRMFCSYKYNLRKNTFELWQMSIIRSDGTLHESTTFPLCTMIVILKIISGIVVYYIDIYFSQITNYEWLNSKMQCGSMDIPRGSFCPIRSGSVGTCLCRLHA